MSPTATSVSSKVLVPLLGMVWRGMWGAAAATAAAQVVATEERLGEEEPEPASGTEAA